MNIVKSYKEPNTNVIWFNINNNNFYYFNNGKWRLMNDLESTLKEILEITYFELKELRDTSKLIPGTTYRITDYNCTTSQEDTQSAGHVFDILVTADDVNVLNENARAIQHSGDTYFANSNLSVWELKYCLDNDTTRFAWADNTNGRGVIYYMKDEFNNECPYDFKNIQYQRYKITACSKSPDLVGQYSISGVTGITVDTSNPYYCYTFSVIDNYNDVIDDVSVIQNKYLYKTYEEKYYKVQNNVIKDYYKTTDNIIKQLLILSNNVFVTDTDIIRASFDESGNIIGTSFYGYYSNTLGNSCYYNTFGNSCYNNTFGNGCYSNTFGDGCYYNTFGNSCYENTFGNRCSDNTFGKGCYNNAFGDSCQDNTFGNYCRDNTFGNGFGDNTFGNSCFLNTLGNYYDHNTFGNDCYINTFGNDYIQYCTFFDGVQYLNVSITTSYTNKLRNMQVLNGTQGTRNSKLQITGSTYVTAGRSYTTTIGMNSSGTLTSKVLMD